MTTKDVNAAIWVIVSPESVDRGILGPMYTRSIDSSMAVIQRRWDDPRVTVARGPIRRGGKWRTWIETRSKAETHKHGEADTPSHALAIALLAALEAEQ